MVAGVAVLTVFGAQLLQVFADGPHAAPQKARSLDAQGRQHGHHRPPELEGALHPGWLGRGGGRRLDLIPLEEAPEVGPLVALALLSGLEQSRQTALLLDQGFPAVEQSQRDFERSGLAGAGAAGGFVGLVGLLAEQRVLLARAEQLHV